MTITAQYKLGPCEPSGNDFPGSEPGTTTEYAGTLPTKTSPVFLSTTFVEAPINTPIDKTAPVSITTPSATSDLAPTKQSSSIMTGPA